MANTNPNVNLNLNGNAVTSQFTPSAGVYAGQQLNFSEAIRLALKAAGITADMIDGVGIKQLTLVASTPQTIDVFTGLTDSLGNALTVARARAVLMKWYSTTDNVPALVGGAGANEWDGFLSSGGTVSVFPSTANNDGFLILAAPQTAGIPISGTNHLLKINPQTAAGQFDLILAICSA